MPEISPLEAKIIKQVEYYFGDINITRDKFMQQITSENDGWISFDTMLKFNRLKTLSDDVDVIRTALSKSHSGLLEVSPEGIRRNPERVVPASFDDVSLDCMGRTVYVKGFNSSSTLDEIIDWLEKHGGKTLNVHMRRTPKDKRFKGSIFAVFETEESAEKFLSSPEASSFGENTMVRMYRKDYLDKKKAEKTAKIESRAERIAAEDAARDEQISSRMSPGALLELSGLPSVRKTYVDSKSTSESETLDQDHSEEKEVPNEKDDKGGAEDVKEEADEDCEALTVINLKKWLTEKIGTDIPIAWVDVDPAMGKAIVRFKQPQTAEQAWTKVVKAFGGKPVIYLNSTLTARVLSGDEEKTHWKSVFAAQTHKAQKRRSGRQNGRNFVNKRRRMN